MPYSDARVRIKEADVFASDGDCGGIANLELRTLGCEHFEKLAADLEMHNGSKSGRLYEFYARAYAANPWRADLDALWPQA